MATAPSDNPVPEYIPGGQPTPGIEDEQPEETSKAVTEFVQPGDVLLDAMLKYQELGFTPLPMGPNKRPLTYWKVYQDREPTKEEMTAWCKMPSVVGVGLVTGKRGFGVLDIDDPMLAAKVKEDPTLADCPMVATPQGGLHLYLREDPATTHSGQLIRGRSTPGASDIKAIGGLVCTFPTPGYRWLTSVGCKPVGNIKEWAVELLERYGFSVTAEAEYDTETVLEGVLEGERDESLFRVACRLRAADVPFEMACELILRAARNCIPPFSSDLALQKVKAAYARYAPTETLPGLSDFGNMLRFLRIYGDEIRFCDLWSKWLVWDSKRWLLDDVRAVYKMAQDVPEAILAEAYESTGERQKALFKWAVTTEGAGKQEALLKHTYATRPIRFRELDSDPWLLNVENGTLDLRDGKAVLHPHNRLNLITKLAPVEYDPTAKAPLWDAFLNRIMDGSEGLVKYLQRVVGYSLTASVAEQCFFLLYGLGANGKSTFLGALLAMLNDYAEMAAPGLLVKSRYDRHPTELADLFGLRLVANVEIGEGAPLWEERLKALTGGDRVSSRRMRENFWRFEPTHKLFLACNDKPTVKGRDIAIWRRIRLIPFVVEIPPREQDKNLLGKLKMELPGILAWAVRGCLEWQEGGLQEPDEVRKASHEYYQEEDRFRLFIDERLVRASGAVVSTDDLFKTYKEWAEAQGYSAKQIGDKIGFGRQMAKRFKKSPDTSHRGFLNLRLKTREELQADESGC